MSDIRNYVLLGEAGCGKSELAINLARRLLDTGKPVDLFDLDMTKSLFRTREQAHRLADMGIRFHFEEQFADAPTVGGGVMRSLKDADSYTVLDVGGDYIGARAIGGYAPLLNREDTQVLYILNPFRPWTTTGERAGLVLSEVLGVSHIRPQRIRIIGNPQSGTHHHGGGCADGLSAPDGHGGAAGRPVRGAVAVRSRKGKRPRPCVSD